MTFIEPARSPFDEASAKGEPKAYGLRAPLHPYFASQPSAAYAGRSRYTLLEYETILANAPFGVAFTRERKFFLCNPAFAGMLGWKAAELIGKPGQIIYTGQESYTALAEIAAPLLSAGRQLDCEWELRRQDGSTFMSRLIARSIDPARPGQGTAWIVEDISDRRAKLKRLRPAADDLSGAPAQRTAELLQRIEELSADNDALQAQIAARTQAELHAQHLADHDALTGLPNRRLLEDRLARAIVSSQRNGRQSAVMFVDLDRFKAVNDALGHAAGDLVLKEMAQRLVGQLREADTVCRIGGDEFVVVLPEIKHASDAAQVARKVLEQLSRPVPYEGRELTVTPSIGISVYPSDGEDAAALIRNADAAMYHAKDRGRANFQFFTSRMNRAALERLSLESDLRAALDKREFRLAYQPIVALDSGRLLGYEALARWRSPRKGRLLPSEFLPLAEESGLILALGAWSLETACRWAAHLPPGQAVALNLSPRQMKDPALAGMIASALDATGLAAARLQLEVPELALGQQIEGAARRLNELHALGVSLWVNAFGRSAIQLDALGSLPLAGVKLDRRLLARVPDDAQRRALLAGLIGFTQTLGLRAVAVGVESEAQREFLKAHGCEAAQGFLLGRPAKQRVPDRSSAGTDPE